MNEYNLIEFFKRYPDDAACRLYLEKRLWKDTPVCPYCGHTQKIYRYKNGRIFKCSACNRQFQVTTGTIYENSNISLQKWFLTFYLLSISKKGISSVELSKAIGVTQKSAWYLLHKIRYMCQHNSNDRKLKNTVECDETYIGGKMRGGKRGRGSENKTPVFGMLERDGGLMITPVPDTKRKTLEPIIYKNVGSGTHIMTDEWKAYSKLEQNFKHSIVKHNQKEYVNGETHVNSLEGAWGLFKRSLLGTYHRPSRQHMDKYCAEFQANYNSRYAPTERRFKLYIDKNNLRVNYRDITPHL